MLIDYHDINQPEAKGKFKIEKTHESIDTKIKAVKAFPGQKNP